MKPILLSLLLIITSASIGQVNVKYKKYENLKDGLSINYPEEWSIMDNPTTIFVFIRPIEKGQQFRENVNLTTANANGIKIKEYSEISLSQFDKYLTQFKKISSEEVIINGQKFIKTIYTHFNQIVLKVAFYQTIKDGLGYNLTCSATEATFDKYAPVFENMIHSFKINKK